MNEGKTDLLVRSQVRTMWSLQPPWHRIPVMVGIVLLSAVLAAVSLSGLNRTLAASSREAEDSSSRSSTWSLRSARGEGSAQVGRWTRGVREATILHSDTESVYSVAFSPDGRLLAVGGTGSVGLWEVPSRRLFRTLTWSGLGSDLGVAVAYSPDGRYLATSGYGVARLWQVPSGTLLWTLGNDEEGDPGVVMPVLFSPDGRYLATTTSYRFDVGLWDVRSGRLVVALKAHSVPLGIAFSPDGLLLATGECHVPGFLELWKVPSGSMVTTVKAHEEPIASVTYSPDGKYVATASYATPSEGARVKLWEVSTERQVFAVRGRSNPLEDRGNPVTFSPDGAYLAAVADDALVKLWKVPSGELAATLKDHSKWLGGVVFSPDGKYVATVGGDNSAKVWSVRSGGLLATLRGHGDVITSIVFSPDGRYLATGSLDGTARLWEPKQ